MTEKEPALLNAYLILGDDELKSNTAIKRLRTRLEQEGDLDFNSQTFEGTKEIDTKELLDSLNTPPLAAPFRLAIIKDVEKAGKENLEALSHYLKSPMPSTIVVMTATKLTTQSKLYKAVSAFGKKAVIDAASRKRSELPNMIRQLAQNYQISLSYEGAAKLSELVGSSTIALNNEVKKLASYVLALGRKEANLDDVLTVVARTNQPSPWDFVDAVSKRDLVQSMEILRLLSRESPVSLLYLCVTRLRELLQYKSLSERRDGKLAKTLGKPEWQLRRLDELSRRFEANELRELLRLSAQLDARMKSGEDARRALEELVLVTCR